MNILKKLLYHDYQRDDLLKWDKTKRRWAKVLQTIPKNSEILEAYKELRLEKKVNDNPALEKSLKVRRVRTLSGVAPFAVMMKPFACPGACTYCVLEAGMPKSYMSDEPAAARAKQLLFDPKQQVLSRIEQMEKTGHSPEKLQIIVIGGTFSAYPDKYKKEFLKTIFDTCNQSVSETIENSHKVNEHTKYRIIGMSIETRPDWITRDELRLLREYGVTKVQMGVQALDDQILARVQRGHGIKEVSQATKLMRDAGFKINYHFMPNLPGSTPEKDVEMGKIMFSDSRFKPDTLKIYPCIVLPRTKLYEEWKRGEYQSYDDETLANVLVGIKQYIPQYCRIDRLQRDITKQWTASGTLKTNMRQIVHEKLAELGRKCQCVRCREVKDRSMMNDNVHLKISDYEANDGLEQFLAFEDDTHLYGMLRLRFPSDESRANPLFPVLKDAALIRELQVFGEQIGIVSHKDTATQHKSLGKRLVSEAEILSKKAGYKKVAIISGVGVRDYYRKLGYEIQDTYMVKHI